MFNILYDILYIISMGEGNGGRLTYYSAVWCTAVWQSLNREILQEERAVPPDFRPNQATINHQENHRSLPHIHPPVRYTNKPTSTREPLQSVAQPERHRSLLGSQLTEPQRAVC